MNSEKRDIRKADDLDGQKAILFESLQAESNSFLGVREHGM